MLTPDLTARDAADLFVAFQSEMNTYWNVFILVALGIVGFVIGQKAPPPRRFRTLLVVAFGVFALGNLYSVLGQHAVMLELWARLRDPSFAGQLASAFDRLNLSPPWRVALYHILLDITVVIALWVRVPNATASRP